MKGSGNLPDAGLELGNLDETELATNQQAVAVPLFAGEASFALHWLCEPFNQFTVEAPAERPSKK
ncbi:MAG: hypothetical protein ACKOET_00710 [Verrucomicrobiota bacterium]